MNTENKRQSLVNRIKASDDYKSFAGILENKKSNEEAAKLILESHAGRLTMKQLDFVFDLIDEPYPCVLGGKPVTGPWFGRLLKRNAQNFFNKSEEEINSWFKIMLDRQIPAVRRMDLLQGEQYKIKGISVGFVTLMLYILEKKNYLIWFKNLHEGLEILYPDLGKYTGRSDQYLYFNKKAMEFAMEFSFEPTEMDWVLSTGVKKVIYKLH